MLDTKFVRDNLDAVKEAMRNRNAAFDDALFVDLDAKRRELISHEEELQAERNKLSKQIGQLMKEGKRDEAEATKERVRTINEELDRTGEQRAQADEALRNLLLATPNMPDETTPVGADENDNPEVRRWGTPRDFAAEGIEKKADDFAAEVAAQIAGAST